MSQDTLKANLESMERAAELFLESFDEKIDDDPGYCGKDSVLTALARIRLRSPAGWLRIEAALRRRKVLASVNRAVKEKCRELEREGQVITLKRSVRAACPGAPVSDLAVIPRGWSLLGDHQLPKGDEPGIRHALRKLVERRRGEIMETVQVPFAHAQVVISGVSVDEFSGEAYLEISWLANGVWLKHLIPRSAISSSGGLSTHLGGKPLFPLHPSNSRDMSEYLVDYEAENRRTTKTTVVSQQMGWHGKGFLLGKDAIGDTGLEFLAPDDGDSQIAESLGRTKGTLKGWVDTVAGTAAYPRVELAIYASLAAPLLEILEIPNFILEWCGKTSSGKSTALSVASSCWGNPDPRSPHSAVGSWASTKVAVERRMATLSHLPLLMDETQLARKYARGETMIPQVMYSCVNGQGDARGSTTGLQRSRTWRTIMLSTGEQRMVDFSKAGGTAARVLCLWGSPFGGEAYEAVRALETGLAANYGHAGREFIRWVLDNRNEWPQWREQLQSLYAEMSPLLGAHGNDAGVTNRLAWCAVALEMAGRLAHRCFDFPWAYKSPVKTLSSDFGGESKTARREVDALEAVASWIAANTHRLENSPEAPDKAPTQGWIGFIEDETASKSWGFVGLHQTALREFLKTCGFEAASVIRRWEELSYIRADKGRLTTRVSIGNRRVVRLVVIRREALEAVGFGGKGSAPVELPF